MKNSIKMKIKLKWDISLGCINKLQFIELTDHGLSDEDFLPIYYEVIETLTSNCKKIVLSQMIEVNQLGNINREDLLNELNAEYQVDSFISDNTSLYLVDNLKTDAYALNLYGPPDIGWIKKVIKFGPSSIPNIIYLYDRKISNWINDVKIKEKIFVKWSNREIGTDHESKLFQSLKMICFTNDGHLVVLVNKINYIDILLIINNIAKKYKYILNIVINENSL
jgi:hypothetical protein